MVVQSKKRKPIALETGKSEDDLPPKLVARLERIEDQNARIEEQNIRMEEQLATIVQWIAQQANQSTLERPLESIIRPSNSEEPKEEEEEDDLSDDEITVVDETNKWEVQYQQLREYRMVHGDCKVPWKWKENPKLASFVDNQKTHYTNLKLGKKGYKITLEHISKLERIGFNWGKKFPPAKSWDEMFEELRKFKERYGHCNVPYNQAKPMPLAVWCANQRYENKLAKHGQVSLLTDDQYKKLQAIGFKWKAPK